MSDQKSKDELLNELQESEEKYRALFDHSRDMIYINDFHGNFLDANSASLDFLGYDKKDISKINYIDILDENEVEKAFVVLQELVETGKMNGFPEFKLKSKDGKSLWVETTGSLLYKNGKPYAIQGVARNITDRKKSEKELQKTLEQSMSRQFEISALLRSAKAILEKKNFEMSVRVIFDNCKIAL